MDGPNQDYFYPHFIQKLFSKKLCHAMCALDTLRNPVRTVYACTLALNVRVSHNIRLYEMSALLAENNFTDSSIVQVKNMMISSCR